jgi:hypothetical protein
MNFEKVILVSCLLFACHANPTKPAVAPVAPTKTEQAKPAQVTTEVKPLECTIYSPEETLFPRWFSQGNAVRFSEQVCDGANVTDDLACFELYSKAFVNLVVERYENGNADVAAEAFGKCADDNANLECFRIFENTMLETNNQLCSAPK